VAGASALHCRGLPDLAMILQRGRINEEAMSSETLEPLEVVKLTPVGAPAPWFVAATAANPRYHLHTIAGRYVVLFFLGAEGHPASEPALAAIGAHRHLFDDAFASCFLVVCASAGGTLRDQLPGLRVLFDPERSISQLYGAWNPSHPDHYTPRMIVLDPFLRILEVAPLQEAQAALARLALQPAPSQYVGIETPAPVLVLPRVFEPEFCASLIQLYENGQPEESGFMRDVDGKTRALIDHSHKRRSDVTIEDQALQHACQLRIRQRLVPEIKKAFQFTVTRMERYIVACYDAQTGGHFRPHRDNTTKGTAHRRFAVTLALNNDFDGGGVRFPEFGPRVYRPPVGGVVVFSCSLLHEALPVTGGRRYAFLPFLYDEEGAQVRLANNAFLDRSVGQYRG
jgi:predicted 2-oxoglutarate/Fe(II)-dependent dioxygenase YbiX/peroxiredoxin